MAKDTYYFSHDYNARNDRKIAALVKDYKSSGYGIFWATCEMMHEEGGSIEFDDLTIDAIAKDMNEDSTIVSEIINKCVDKYRLFTKQNEAESFASMLRSSRIERNLIGKNEKKEIKANAGRLGGIKSGESRRNNNLLKQNEALLQPASSNEPKESKVKESKENIIQGNNLWFLQYYHSTYGIYKDTFNGQSTTEYYFKEWKELIDFIYKNKYEELFGCKFLSPHDYAKIAGTFTKDKWDEVFKKILSTGIKPEHNLFFRIPEFLGYSKQNKNIDLPKNGESKIFI